MEKDKGRRLQLQNILWHDGIPSFLDTSEALLKQMGGKHFVANKVFILLGFETHNVSTLLSWCLALIAVGVRCPLGLTTP